jgi:peptidoglycan hydrolase CwlO-like protein
LKLFQLYHNKQELTEKREIADKKKEEVIKLEKRKEVSDDDIKAKKKELAVYNKELAADEQKIKELVKFIVEFLGKFFFVDFLGSTN